MPYYPDKHHRKSIRLEEYDYRAEGAYFITICAHQYASLFGKIQQTTMHLSDYGKIAESCWDDIPKHFPHVELDGFVVMPNHIHGILLLVDDSIISKNQADSTGLPWQAQKRQFSKPIAGSLPTIINAYKSRVTRIIRKNYPAMTTPIWHRNYYEHVIRDEIALITIRNYIENNPIVWEQDKFYKA